MKGLTRAIIWVAILFPPALTCGAELDASSEVYSVIPRSLKWENVRSPWQWVAGRPLAENREHKAAFVVLASKQTTTFRVPRQELIRILPLAGQCNEHQIEAWSSDGSGVYRRLPLHFNEADGSFIAAPSQPNASLAMIRLSKCEGSVCLALFVSRHDAAPVVDEYMKTVCLHHATTAELQRRCEKTSQSFSRVDANQPLAATVSGPVRLRFDSRFRFNDTESQSRQTYQLVVTEVDQSQRVLEFASSSDIRQPSIVNGTPEVLGTKAVNYLDLGPGQHHLNLTSNAPIYLRVDAKKCAYRHPINDALDLEILQTPTDGPLDANTALLDSVAMEKAAWYSARDNGFRESGLKAYMLMRAAAARRTHQPELRQLAERMRLHRTFYRNVLPSSQPFSVQPRLGVFFTERLRDRDEDIPDVVLKDTIIEDALAQVTRAYFVPVSATQQTPNVYAIPASLGASLLRVAVDRKSLNGPTRFFVQFDNRQPIQMTAFPDEPLCVEDFAPTRATASFVAQHWQHSSSDHGTLGGPYARDYQPAPFVAAGISELILPSGVRRVSIWIEEGQSPPQVAVQYRATRPFSLTEATFRSTAVNSRLSELHGGMLSCMVESTHPVASGHDNNDNFYSHQIDNMFVPLRRLIKTHRRAFESSVVNRISPRSSEQLPPQEIERRVATAERLVKEKHYAAGIELWTDIARRSSGANRPAALLSRAKALEAAGELFLADRELRGLFLFDPNPTVQQIAYKQLLSQLRKKHDSFSVEQLVATNFVRNPSIELANELAEVLIDNGRYDLALHCLLAIPHDRRRQDLMVRTAFSQRWWKTFERALPELPHSERAVWHGRRLLYQGKTKQAMRAFELAGATGQQHIEHCRLGLKTLRAMRSEQADVRANAILDWEQWQASVPGPFKWTEEQSLVHRSPGYRAVYHKSRDVYSHYYLSQKDRPAVLRIFGPVKLKLETRPIHHSPSSEPLDGWVRVSGSGHELIYPITNDFPSTELVLVDNERSAPGRLVNAEIAIGPGMHELSVRSNETDLILRAFAKRPEVPSPILPPINEETFVAAVTGQYGSPALQGPPRHRLLVLENSRLQPIPFMACVPNSRPLFDSMECVRKLAPLRAQTASSIRPSNGDIYQQMARIVESAEQDASQRIRRICEARELVDFYPSDVELRNQLTMLMKGTTWQRFKQFGSSAGVHSEDVSTWQPESSSIRVRKALSSGRIEAQHAIVGNKALVINVQNNQLRTFKVTLNHPTISYLHHGPLTILCQTSVGQDRRVVLQPGDTRTHSFTLPPGQHELRFSTAEQLQNHYVLVSLADSVSSGANYPAQDTTIQTSLIGPRERFYEVATHREPIEINGQGPAVFRVDERIDGETRSRITAITTGEETVSLRPSKQTDKALFRVFELVLNPQYESSPTKRVPNPSVPVANPELAAGVDRIFDSQQDELRLSMLEECQSNDPASLAFALGIENADSLDSPIQWRDAATLGAQLDRTWGYSLGVFQRQPVEESQNISSPGRFTQADIARHTYDPWQDRYDETHAFFRIRNASGPTLGLTYEVRRTIQDVPALLPRWSQCACDPHPLSVFWKAASYVQVLDPTDEGDSVVWSGRLQGGVSRRYEINECWHHSPSLVGFIRPLSLRQSRDYAAGDLDQDLFTPYKAEHRWGIRYFDRFTWQQSVDSQCWIQPSVTLNENLITPDHTGLQVGTTQLFGDIDFNASYRITAFLRDDDRNRTSLQHVVYLDAVFERWQNRNVRHEIGLSVRYDIGNADTSGNLVWTVFANDRRGYRDIHPRHMRFGATKRQRAFRRGFLD